MNIKNVLTKPVTVKSLLMLWIPIMALTGIFILGPVRKYMVAKINTPPNKSASEQSILDPGIVVTVKDGKIVCEQAMVDKCCLNPTTGNIAILRDTTIIMNLATGKTAGY